MTNTLHEDYEPGQVPLFINGEGAEVVISSGMGTNATRFFSPHGIEVATVGTIREAIGAFLRGGIKGRRPHGRYHQRSTPCIPC